MIKYLLSFVPVISASFVFVEPRSSRSSSSSRLPARPRHGNTESLGGLVISVNTPRAQLARHIRRNLPNSPISAWTKCRHRSQASTEGQSPRIRRLPAPSHLPAVMDCLRQVLTYTNTSAGSNLGKREKCGVGDERPGRSGWMFRRSLRIQPAHGTHALLPEREAQSLVSPFIPAGDLAVPGPALLDSRRSWLCSYCL